MYVGAGEQTESIVLWPDLTSPSYQAYVVEEKNVAQPEQRPLPEFPLRREGR